MNEIELNLLDIRNRIAYSCAQTDRSTSEITLLLATKTVSTENIKIALRAGEYVIGENKVQELRDKYLDLKEVQHQSHFIGHLQTNKIKDVIAYADCIQSIDRWALAEKLQERLVLQDKTMDIFIQVNTSQEESKFGIEPEKALALALQIQTLDRLKIKGLMTIGLFSAETEKVRACFRLLKSIQREMLVQGVPVQELSMGMSGDLEVAIEEGSTMVRVGTAIFGKRVYPDSYYWNEKG